MSENTISALDTFSTTVTSSINASDVLTIMGKALVGGVGIYLVQWAGRKIIRTFTKALNGKVGV